MVDEIWLNPWFYGVFLLVLVLEQLVPAQKTQQRFSVGARTDLVWLFAHTAVHAAIMPVYPIVLRFVYDRYFSFLTVESASSWPWTARLLVALLLVDVVFWFTHFVRHKVKTLWYFHAVHHSQKELSFFSEYRAHPIDDLFIGTIGFIPLLMFQHSFVTIIAVVWIRHWHTRLYHANIRSNFGPLRYLFVTPQSHRVHHSIEPRHFDKNFGLTFSLWDQLFGTQYRGWDEYPETGIPDQDFPFEQDTGHSPIRSVVEQLLYPFRALVRDGMPENGEDHATL